MKLNSEQKKAIKTKDKNHLVVASAGSGKTRVLTSRALHLLHSNEDDILLLTFTVKAAEEMITRIKNNLDNKNLLKRITSGTFHSFSHKILRKYANHIGYDKNFTILDAKDSVDLMGLAAKGQGCKLGARTLIDICSSSINTGVSVKTVARNKLVDLSKEELILIKKTFKKYVEYKTKYSIMDFDDIIVNMRKLLLIKDKDIKNTFPKYNHILVDEFQDTNQIQIDIITGLITKKTNLFVVGDKNQNIYAFRGANPQHIIDFPKTFNSTYTILQQNYRSTQEILNLANEVAKDFKDEYNIKMFSELSGNKPRYIRYNNEEEQSQKVSTEIYHLIKKGANPKDIAILYRSNSSADLFETQLRNYNIPYLRKGGQSLFEMKHIKDILALLRVSAFYMDTISWHRVMQALPGVGSVTSTEAIDYISDKGIKGLKKYRDTKHWKSMEMLYDTVSSIIKNNKNVLKAFDIAVNYWVIERTKSPDKTEEFKETISSLRKIVGAYPSIKKCLLDLTLSPKDDEEKKNGITLSTGHSAKGLEWKHVYLINIIDDKIPSKYFIINKKDNTEDETKIEEELRLFYVMITRAQKELTLCAPLSEEEHSWWHQFKKLPKKSLQSETRFLKNKNIKDIVKLIMPSSNAILSDGATLLSKIRKDRGK